MNSMTTFLATSATTENIKKSSLHERLFNNNREGPLGTMNHEGSDVDIKTVKKLKKWVSKVISGLRWGQLSIAFNKKLPPACPLRRPI